MKKVTSAIIICLSLIMLTMSLIFSYAEESSQYSLIDGKEADEIDASFRFINFNGEDKLKSAPLYLFLGIDKDDYDKLYKVKDVNIAIFENNENAEKSASAFIYHYLKLLDDNRNFFTEIRIISVYDELFLNIFDILLYFIDVGRLEAMTLPNRFTQINKNIIDKNKNNVYNKIYVKLIEYGVAIDKYDVYGNFDENELSASLFVYDDEEPLNYYFNLFNEEIPIDYNVINSASYGLSPLLSLSYLKGRMGNSYILKDGKQKSVKINDVLVCGFIFYDADQNGYYDAKWDILYEGVRVKAYLSYKGSVKFLSFDTTDKSGYYRLIIPKIYANGFDKIVIEAEKVDGLNITFRSNETLLMNNDIKSDYKSDELIFNSPIELKIINIGYSD